MNWFLEQDSQIAKPADARTILTTLCRGYEIFWLRDCSR